MNITVNKDGEDITFLYSTENIQTRQGLVLHKWENENHKGTEGEPFVFIGGEAIDKEHPERMEKYRLQAEGIIKSKLGIVDVVPTPVVEEVIEPKTKPMTEELIEPMIKAVNDITAKEDEDVKKKTQD